MSIPILFPMPKTRKGAIITISIVCAVWLILIAVFLVLYYYDQKSLEDNGRQDFNTLTIEDLKHDIFVYGKIDIAIDSYAENYETTMGVRTSEKSTDLYYLIPIYHTDDSGYITADYFISFRTGPINFDVIDNIIEQTWTADIEEEEYAEFYVENAKIIDLPASYKSFLNEYIEAPDFYYGGSFIDWCIETNILGTKDEHQIREKIVPYLISETSQNGMSLTTVWIFLGIFMLSVFLLLYLIFKKGPIKGFGESIKKENFKSLRQISEETL